MKKITFMLTCCLLFVSMFCVFFAQAQTAPNYEKFKTLDGYNGNLEAIAFSPNGKFIAAGTSFRGWNLAIYDASTWKLITTVDENEDWITSLAFSRDSKILATADTDKKVILFDTATWKKVKTIKAGFVPNAIALNKDGSLLAVAGNDGDVMLWDTNQNTAQKLYGQKEEVRAITFSPDSSQIAAGSHHNTVTIWSVATADIINTLDGHRNNVEAVAYSPDGKYLVSGSEDNESSIIVWDAKTGAKLKVLRGYEQAVCGLDFSRDGKTMLSGDCRTSAMIRPTVKTDRGKCRLLLWDVSTWTRRQEFPSDCTLSGVSFNPDGKYFLTGHERTDRRITIYERK